MLAKKNILFTKVLEFGSSFKSRNSFTSSTFLPSQAMCNRFFPSFYETRLANIKKYLCKSL